MKNWSKYQNEIFRFVETGTGNAIVEAVAGSGKSTTIVEALSRVPASQSSIFLAFNKSIAEELKARGVNARTFHSLTYGPVTKSRNVRTIDADKIKKLCKQHLKGSDEFIYGSFICKLVGLARQAGIGCLVHDVESEWLALVDHHDLELDNENGNLARAVELSREMLDISNQSQMVDFDDLLYLAVKDGLVLPKFFFVFVDEAQDTNAIQRALLRKIMGPKSRMVAVGDPAQAIYGFRGADSDSLGLIGKEFNCISLPLTVSYRCPTAVVAHARKWVSHIEAADDAPVGEVIDFGTSWKLQDYAPGDLVVCRTTAHLIQLAFRMMKARIPARVMGREIGQGLKSLINKMGASSIDQLIEKLDKWALREIEKALAKQQDDKVQAIQDKADAIACLAESLQENQRTITQLISEIDSLFSDKLQAVTLATIHKAKGLEADRVFWLNSQSCPAKWAKLPWQREQEKNLCYVATTRARSSLYLIESK